MIDHKYKRLSLIDDHLRQYASSYLSSQKFYAYDQDEHNIKNLLQQKHILPAIQQPYKVTYEQVKLLEDEEEDNQQNVFEIKKKQSMEIIRLVRDAGKKIYNRKAEQVERAYIMNQVLRKRKFNPVAIEIPISDAQTQNNQLRLIIERSQKRLFQQESQKSISQHMRFAKRSASVYNTLGEIVENSFNINQDLYNEKYSISQLRLNKRKSFKLLDDKHNLDSLEGLNL